MGRREGSKQDQHRQLPGSFSRGQTSRLRSGEARRAWGAPPVTFTVAHLFSPSAECNSAYFQKSSFFGFAVTGNSVPYPADRLASGIS